MEKEVVSRLVYSMIQFLQSQLEGGTGGSNLSEEGIESVEVAVQCLETAYGVSLSQNDLAVSKSLYQIFNEATKGEPVRENATRITSVKMESAPKEATPEEKEEAEQLKNEGNKLMRDEKFTEALDCYTKAISKDCLNAVYYCNRAAAHSKLNNQREAIEDCKRALEIEPQYSKAYGRMGLAYSSLNDHHQAKECYKKALELEPDNDSYRGNLSIAEEKILREPQPRANSLGGFGPGGLPFGLGNLAGLGGPGGPDLASMLNNPALMNMATQLMSDPNMQNMHSHFRMSSFMGNVGGLGGPATVPTGAPSAPAEAASNGGMEALLTAGRQLAEQMQSQHPELVEQIRQQMNRGAGGSTGDSQNSNDQDPPPQS
nr:small glutamine-rich tetratricopeptide repeat-containing protein alpha-like isoform X1 [Procambarus clarkii]